jgi:cell division activator
VSAAAFFSADILFPEYVPFIFSLCYVKEPSKVSRGATRRVTISYDRSFVLVEFVFVNSSPMKPMRQQNRRVISYVPRIEPAPPEHASKVDGYRDVWLLRGKYVAFVLMGERFTRSPTFSVPEAAQRWAVQIRQDGEIGE